MKNIFYGKFVYFLFLPALKSRLRHTLVDLQDIENGSGDDARRNEILSSLRDIRASLHAALDREDEILVSDVTTIRTFEAQL